MARCTRSVVAHSPPLRVPGRDIDITGVVLAVELNRPAHSFAQVDGRRPAGRAAKLARVGVEIADVDGLLFGRPLDVLDAAGARDLDQQGGQVAMTDRFVA